MARIYHAPTHDYFLTPNPRGVSIQIPDYRERSHVDVVIQGRQIRPASPEGDSHFGLESGTNGSAAQNRRVLVTPPGSYWVRHNGKPATGLLLKPGSGAWSNPWGGR